MTTPTEEKSVNLADFFTPHWAQEEILSEPSKRIVLECGRRFGKGRVTVFKVIQWLNEISKKPAPISLVPPLHVWILAPSYPQSNQAWLEMLSYFPQPLIRQVVEDEHKIWLNGWNERPEGGLIEFKSAERPDSLQTAGLDALWVTEAQDIPESAWSKARGTLTSPDRDGYLMVEGIPPTYEDHWFHRLWEIGNGGSDIYKSFRYTTFDNPYLTTEQLEEIEEAKNELLEETWRRMYLAEIGVVAERAFGRLDDIITPSQNWLDAPEEGHFYVAGIDFARKVDATVVVTMDACHRKAVHYDYMKGVDWDDQLERIEAVYKVWKHQRLFADATGLGDVPTQQLRRRGLPLMDVVITGGRGSSPDSRQAIVTSLQIAVEKKTLRIPYETTMVREMRGLRPVKLPSGVVRYEAPPGGHDDWPFAIALALRGCVQPEMTEDTWQEFRPTHYAPTAAEITVDQKAGTVTGPRTLQRKRARWERKMEEYQEQGIDV